MHDTTDQNSQTRRIGIAIALVLVVSAGIVWYLNRGGSGAETPQAFDPPVAAPAPLLDETPAPIQHPLTDVPVEAPATDEQVPAEPVDPDLEASAALDEVFGPGSLASWLISEQLSRRLVATTDNLGRNARIEPLRPLRPPSGQFVVERAPLDDVGNERITLAPANAARYDAMVMLLSRVDMARAAAVYRRIYPRLQGSYEELGYPGAYFNDRVVQTIDHLLATPEPEGPLLLEQPKVMYVYADADLEARSAGQKLLLRMGNAHARVVKQKLREFRAQITTRE